MLKLQDIGEVAYGGAVTLANWWDGKRITDGSLTDRDLIKKAGFWTYLAVGVPSLLMSAFNWPRGGTFSPWTDRLAHGFLYGLPGFVYSTVVSLQPTASRTRSRSDAVAQAQAILREKQAMAAKAARSTGYDVVNPYEILT